MSSFATKLQTTLGRLFLLGVHDGLSTLENQRVRIFNQGFLLAALALLANAVRLFILGDSLLNAPFYPVLLCLLVPGLHHFRFYKSSRFLITYLLPLVVLSYLVQLGNNSGISYYFFVLVLSSIMYYDKKHQLLLNLLYQGVLVTGGLYFAFHYELPSHHVVTQVDYIIHLCTALIGITIGVYNFITGIKNQELAIEMQNRELRIANDSLEASKRRDDAKQQLLTMLAHDLRGPATAFSNLSKKLSHLVATEPPDRIAALTSQIERSGEELFFNLENMLNWVSSQKDTLLPQPANISVRNTVSTSMRGVAMQAAEKSITIRQGCQTDLNVLSDPEMLNTILYNLLNNAIKYSPVGSEVVLEANVNEEIFRLSVSDQGAGIPPDVIESLASGDIINSSHAQRGYGLGLHICRQFATLLGGQLVFGHNCAGGATVSLELPYA